MRSIRALAASFALALGACDGATAAPPGDAAQTVAPPAQDMAQATPAAADLATGDLAQPQQSTSGGGIKWHPGHYAWLDPNTTQAQQFAMVETMTSETNVQGFQVFLDWNALEGATAGDYSAGFALVDSYLAELKAQKVPKRLMLGLGAMWYGTPPKDCSGLALPKYVATDYGCAIALPGAAGGTAGAAKYWEQPTMDRLIALSQAYGARYDGNPLFEMFMAGGGETAAAVPGFNVDDDITQLDRWMDAAKVAWPHTQARLAANYLGSDDNMATLLSYYADSDHAAIGGPDPELPLPNITRTITANELFRAATGSGPDYRGKVAWVGEVQAFGLGVRYTQTPSDLFTYQYETMHANYFIWYCNDGYPGGAPQHWNTGILPFIQSINGKTNAACPTNYKQCDTN